MAWRSYPRRSNTPIANSSYLVIKIRPNYDAFADQYVNEMDFRFLYHKPSDAYSTFGLNLDAGQLDQNYYDLLASEARIASIIAIAKGETYRNLIGCNWVRPVTRVDRVYTYLLSWNGTMFEYSDAPALLAFLPGYSCWQTAPRAPFSIKLHMVKAKSVPWGISESGFYRFDANQNYQYRAFGVPGLGFKRVD